MPSSNNVRKVTSENYPTDAGREGELIFRLVYEAAGCSKPFSRLWISSMEDVAIREGFVDLRPGADYDPLYQSALCRQKADWLIGINASRLFSVLYHRTLNIGRVQTPTLAMLADRDGKIVLFRKEKYHHVRLALEGAEAVSDRIVSPEDAQAIRDAYEQVKIKTITFATYMNDQVYHVILSEPAGEDKVEQFYIKADGTIVPYTAEGTASPAA